jgi:hypothetical protein
MADYYPLIARAIAGLDPSAPGEARRALYERARAALIAQLRSVQPPLSESEITRERLSLEEAVRKVESEAAQRAREASRAGSRSGDAFRAGTPRANPAKPGDPPPPARARPPSPPAPPQQQRNLRPEQPAPSSDVNPPSPPRPPQPSVGMQDPTLPPSRDRPVPPRRPDAPAQPPNQTQSPGVRGFRDIAADADDLGRAAAQANRSARKTYANVPSPSPEFDRLEPSMENRGADPDLPYSYDESAEEAARWTPPPDQPGPRPRAPDKDRKKKAARAPRIGGGGFPFKSAIAIGIVLILAGAAILWGPSAVSFVRSMLNPSATVQAPKDSTTPAPRPKIADRVGQPSSSETVAPVAQRVVLYDEDPADPKGKQYVGTVVWRTEQIKGTGTTPGDLAVRADVDIPDRKFKMTISFRRNTDTSLPASHTAELTFILPQNFDGGGVSNVPGILMKSNEQARGTPLAGLAVKVTDGFFLVGLSNVDSDRSRNLQLLKERSWFDIPLVYANQRRAIIAIEKGAPGERAFQDAFAAWGE